MSTIKDLIKKTELGKRLRVSNRIRKARRELFTSSEITELEKDASKIHSAVFAKLAELPDSGQGKLAEMDLIIQKSPLAQIADLDVEALKDDMLFWHYAYGFSFNEYVSYHFFNRSREERLTFMSDRDIACLCYAVNDPEDMRIVFDKSLTYERFSGYYGRDAITISKESDFNAFKTFISTHERFVKKNTLQSCGRSVELIDLNETTVSDRELFESFVSQGKTILEEVVVQSELLASFNPSSVNTVRCITVNTKDRVVAPFFFMKTGRAGSFVDNGAAGGLLVAVDGEIGVLGDATDEFGNRFETHPDSGVEFRGFQLPDWNSLGEMCCEISSGIPKVRIIGWDLAHTDKGWIVIEGNSMTEVIGPQSTQLSGIREKVDELRAVIA